MRSGERKIQQELRRQAAQLPIPTDMWEQINGRLETTQVRAVRPQRVTIRTAHWRPVLALIAAAGMLWLTVAPSGSRPALQAEAEPVPAPIMVSKANGDETPSAGLYRQSGYDVEGFRPEDVPEPAEGPRTPTSRPIAVQ